MSIPATSTIAGVAFIHFAFPFDVECANFRVRSCRLPCISLPRNTFLRFMLRFVSVGSRDRARILAWKSCGPEESTVYCSTKYRVAKTQCRCIMSQPGRNAQV